jgi:tRNA nucleotidyltransferase (CCA-adding enzyme)
MSDYMFMLENHLNAAQARVVAELQTASAEVNLNLFLTGGAVRDMLGGFPIRDLDFTVEGNPAKLVKSVAHRTGAEIVHTEDARKCYELVFPAGVRAEVAMARQERFPKPGAKPHVSPATIHEDLRCRDFTVNALALSLNRASRGLLLDPTNGLGDLERRELRAISNYALYDSPIRLFRLIRLKVRLGFQIAERTQSQYANAREAGVEKLIGSAALLEELRNVAAEPNPGEVLQAWESEGLLAVMSPLLTGAKLNLPGFAKLHKAKQLLPFGVELAVDDTALFFYLLTEKLTPKERAAFVTGSSMKKETVDAWQKLEGRSKKLEKDLTSGKLQKPSQIYNVLSKAPAEQALFLLLKTAPRVVQDRIKNYLQKYLPAAQEVTDRQVIEAGGVIGTPKFERMKAEMVSKRLDSRPKKPPVEPVPEEPPAPVGRPSGGPGRPPGSPGRPPGGPGRPPSSPGRPRTSPSL